MSMIAKINKEYSTPNAAKCKENAERIEKQTRAFLAKGGTIEVINGELEITSAHEKTKAKRKEARERGLENARNKQGALA